MNARFSLGLGDGGSVNTDPTGNRGQYDYHPTVSFLMILVLAEFAAVILLRYAFRTTHGG